MPPQTNPNWSPEEVLDVHPGSPRFTCSGTSDTGRRCRGTTLPVLNTRVARAILDELRDSWHNLSVIVYQGWLFPQLHLLATMTICSARHRYGGYEHPSSRVGNGFDIEAIIVANRWFEILRDMPDRVVLGGIPAMPAGEIHFPGTAQPTVLKSKIKQERVDRSGDNSTTDGVAGTTSTATAPLHQPTQTVPHDEPTPSPVVPLATAPGDTVSNAPNSPVGSNLYSATPPPVNRPLPPHQTQRSANPSPRNDQAAPVRSNPPVVDSRNTTRQTRTLRSTQNPTFSTTNPTNTAQPETQITPPSTIPPSHSTTQNEATHQTPAPPPSINPPPTQPSGLRSFLPSNIGSLISTAVITALSGSSSLEQALNTSLDAVSVAQIPEASARQTAAVGPDSPQATKRRRTHGAGE
ncbi:hypothetical protein GLAREA_04398 [Glarea lozoyensis ATCC 20868]|uniref:Uncharacterized protein n=1 Tax=Glarea lozoyensis (strain ATCC 20868 / MF5171) TaxID=1116229 RepID=S3CM58_GLAL2|nr:uncharacterized protein GLAREA_04398 [Glarea lozoyensis ATCC 20868]EPE27607.1 hypothetical protein GLAREA_04398 [Glarea lozoyensis ATCC 20868]